MVNTTITFNILDFIVRKKLEDQKRFCFAYIATSDHGLISIFYTLHSILCIKVKKGAKICKHYHSRTNKRVGGEVDSRIETRIASGYGFLNLY